MRLAPQRTVEQEIGVMRPRLLTAFLCLLGLAVFSSRLQAQTQLFWDINGPTADAGGATPAGTWGVNSYWSSSSTGAATTTAWTSGNIAVFSAGTDATGAYTVTVSGTQTIGGLTVQEGTPTFTGGSLSFTGTTSFNIANTATIASVLTGTGGELEKIGSGTLILSGANTYTGGTTVIAGTLNLTGSISHISSDTLVNSTVGPTLNITGGGDLNTDRLRIGITGSTYTGTVTVDGIGSTVTNTTYLYVGEAGVGDLSITNGGAVIAPNTSIGNNTGGDGEVLVSGTGSTLTNSSTLYVGSAGLGYLEISNGALVTNVNGSVGNNPGGSGDVYVDTGGTWNTTGALTVGNASSGDLSIYGGGTVTAGSATLGASSGLFGAIALNGTGTTFSSTGNLIVGGSGDGDLDIGTGADAITGGQATLANNVGSLATVSVDGAGSSWSVTGPLIVGNSGTAGLHLTDSGLLTVGGGAGTITLGANTGSTGALYLGEYNVEGGTDAGILNAASITTGSGTGKVYFESYGSSKAAPYYLTKDGTSGGAAIAITGATQVQNSFGYTVLTGTNTYSGGTTITGGTLVAGTSGALGSGTVQLNGGTLSVNSGVTLPNTLAFAANGGTLGGTGTFGSALTIGSNVHVAPGNSVGTVSFSNGLTLASGGTLDFEVQSAGNGYDLVSVSGGPLAIIATSANRFTLKIISLNISGAAGPVNDFSSASSYAWIFATSAAGITGFDANAFSLNTANFANSLGIGSFFVTQSGNDLILNFTPVPEPSTYALLAAGLALTGLGYRRRRYPPGPRF